MTLNSTQKWIAFGSGGAVVIASAAIVVFGVSGITSARRTSRATVVPAKLEPAVLPAPQVVPDVTVPAPAEVPLTLGTGETYFGKGETLYRTRDYAAASRYLQAEVDAHPDRFYPQYLLGLSLWKEGRPAEAADALTRAAAIDGKSIKARVNLARVLEDAGRHEEALAAAEAAVGLGPDDRSARNIRGCALLGLHRRDEAIAEFNAVIAQNPDDAWALNNLGYALIGAGRCDEAVMPLEKAVGLDGSVGVFHNNLGMAYERTGRRDDAVKEYRAAVQAGAFGAAESNLARLGGSATEPSSETTTDGTATIDGPATAGGTTVEGSTTTGDATVEGSTTTGTEPPSQN